MLFATRVEHNLGLLNRFIETLIRPELACQLPSAIQGPGTARPPLVSLRQQPPVFGPLST
jgi:hypothetical protein